MGKRQEAAKKTRRKIVEAAARLHQEKGLASVSIDEITALAGVSKGSFYVYFKRKEDVASAIALQDFDALQETLDESGGTPLEKLADFLVESVRLIEKQGISLCKEWMKSAVSPAEGTAAGRQKLEYDRGYILGLLRQEARQKEAQSSANAEKAWQEAVCDAILAEYYGNVTLWSMTEGSYPMVERMEHFTQCLPALLERSREEPVKAKE